MGWAEFLIALPFHNDPSTLSIKIPGGTLSTRLGSVKLDGITIPLRPL